MYPEELVSPMRKELIAIGFEQLMTAMEVENVMSAMQGTALVVINSVCGCAAGTCRPGVKIALSKAIKHPDKYYTVFAGMEKEAVSKLREYTLPYPPSSPSIALFKDGKLVHFIGRHNIEGRSAEMIADGLLAAFDTHC